MAHTTTLSHDETPTAVVDGVARAPVVRRLVLIALVAFAGRSLYVLTVLQHEEYPGGLDDAGLVRSYDELYYTGAARALALVGVDGFGRGGVGRGVGGAKGAQLEGQGGEGDGGYQSDQ